jgi:hypothetical protein
MLLFTVLLLENIIDIYILEWSILLLRIFEVYVECWIFFSVWTFIETFVVLCGFELFPFNLC